MNSAISVIVMAFNEANSLGAVVREIDSVLSELARTYEIVIVNDGSSDGTGEVAEQLTKEFSRVRVVHHESNRGLGCVYRTGFLQAKGDFVTFFPADGQFPASIIKQFIPLMDEADMVLGYFSDNRPLLARGLSKAERALFRLLFGPLPKFQGVMMFKQTLLKELELRSWGRGWTVAMELIIRAQRRGYRMLSVPTELRPRMNGKTKVKNLFTIWANLRQAIALRRNF